MFKVFAFLKRNANLLSHDEYRAGHVGYHCGQSRRLKNIRGYLVNIWANTPFREKVGEDLYQQLTINEPKDFLDWWDGFPEVYFDNRDSWVSATTVEPNRAMADGLVVDPDWSLDDGPFLFDPVIDKPGEFKPCHIRMHEHIVVPVERKEQKPFKLMAFFKCKDLDDRAGIQDQVMSVYAPALKLIQNINGCTINIRDDDQADAMRGFYPDESWGHSEDGVAHRAEFCAMWHGAVALHFDSIEDFRAARQKVDGQITALEEKLFSSLWYVEVDENLVVLPNRDPAPDFYFR